MIRLLLCFLITLISNCCGAQNDFFVLKKGDRSIQAFRKDSYITFQTKGAGWLAGIITRIENDSFTVRPYVVHYTMMGVDSVHYLPVKTAIADITVLPRKTAMLVFRNESPVVLAGHEKFVWVKNGLIFQALGGGYAALNIINHLGNGDPPFGRDNRLRLGIAGLVFLVGEILHLQYKKYIYLGKKFHLEIVLLK